MAWFGSARAEFRVENRVGDLVKIYTLSVPVSMAADEIEALMVLVGMVEPRLEITGDIGNVATFTRDLRMNPA